MICMFILRRYTRRLNRKWFNGEARNPTCDPCLQAVVFGRDPWLSQYWPGGIIVFVVLCPGTPKGFLKRLRSLFLWPCSLAVPVLAGWVCVYGGSMSRNSRRLNRQWFWF